MKRTIATFICLFYSALAIYGQISNACTDEERSCLRGPRLRLDTIDVNGLGTEQVEIRQTNFMRPFLAHWGGDLARPSIAAIWAVADSLVVRFASDLSPSEAQQFVLNAVGPIGIETKKLSIKNTYLVSGHWSPASNPASNPPSYLLSKASALRPLNGVVWVAPDYLYFSLAGSSQPPTDPDFQSRQDDLKDLGALAAWTVSTGSNKVRVGILDTGAYLQHPDLLDNFAGGENILAPSLPPNDDNGHGTFCAGIIGAEENKIGVVGVNWLVTMVPIKFLDYQGCGSSGDAIEAINAAIKEKVDIISASWGGFPPSPGLKQAIQDADTAKILFVAGAGNCNLNLDDPKNSFYPAGFDIENVISVGATKDDGSPMLNWGHGKHRVHLSAPGESIYSTVFDKVLLWGEDGGTSASTAFVAGACALVKAAEPGLSYLDIRNRIIQSATDPSSKIKGTGASCSEGRLNLANAIKDKALTQVQCP